MLGDLCGKWGPMSKLSVAANKTGNWFRRFGWFEKRVILVMGGLLVGWLITIIVLLIFHTWLTGQTGQFRDEMLREILAAWTGELLFFTFVGGVITIGTLRNPMQEGIEERMRILFGRAHVPDAVMKYNRDAITRLAAYSKTGRRIIILEAFDQKISAYKARIKTSYDIQNLFPDIHYSDSISMRITPDKFEPNAPQEIGRVTSIRLGNNETVANPLIVDQNGFTSDIKINIPPGKSLLFSWEFTLWLRVNELQTLRPRRIVEQFYIEIVSQCDQNARIEIDGETRVLLYNQPVKFPLVQGVSPGERIGVYKPLMPA